MPGGPPYGFTLPSSRSSGGGPAFGASLSFSAPTSGDLFRVTDDRSYPTLTVANAQLSTIADIDLTSAASTPLYAVPTGKSAVIRYVVVRCTEATSVTVVALAGVGVTGTDVYPDQQLLGLDASDLRFVFPNGPGSKVILSAGDVLNFVVSTGATATSQAASVDVFGDEF